jgi:post-segregation antitoxin (ccd killing protein)
MPGDVYDDLAAVARARGVDVSGVLNWLISEARPRLIEELAVHQKAMLKATASRAWEGMEPVDALRSLRELLGKLQDEYTALSKRVLDKDKQRAA